MTTKLQSAALGAPIVDTWKTIADERRRLAADLEGLTPTQWSTRTVCEAWDVKAVAAHLVLPFEVSKPRFMITAIKNRRDLPKTVDELSARVNDRLTTAAIVDSLRANAESKWTPPGSGPEMPLAEIVVHGGDIRQALDLPLGFARAVIEAVLDSVQDPSVQKDYASRVQFDSASNR